MKRNNNQPQQQLPKKKTKISPIKLKTRDV